MLYLNKYLKYDEGNYSLQFNRFWNQYFTFFVIFWIIKKLSCFHKPNFFNKVAWDEPVEEVYQLPEDQPKEEVKTVPIEENKEQKKSPESPDQDLLKEEIEMRKRRKRQNELKR